MREVALKLAQEQKLDLVEIAPKANPPVCRIIDFSKFKYEQHKRKREAQKKHKKWTIKEIRIRLHIGEHDYNLKLQQTNKFLQEGHKVKVSLFFKGREIRYFSEGQKLVEKFIEAINKKVKVERPPIKEGRNIVTLIAPIDSGEKNEDKN